MILFLGLVSLLKVENEVRGFEELEWIISEFAELGVGVIESSSGCGDMVLIGLGMSSESRVQSINNNFGIQTLL